MRESETSSIAKLKANSPPAIRFAIIKGTMIVRTARIRPAPKFIAASSSSPLVCSRPATVARTMYGSRRTPYAITRSSMGFGFAPSTLMTPSSGSPSPKGHRNVIATYPNAMTKPGTASGNIDKVSSKLLPRIFVLTTM